MCNDLRKVTFTLGSYEFQPDPTPKEKEEMEKLSKQRSGYFHRWAAYVDTSKDIPYVKTMALSKTVRMELFIWLNTTT